MNTIKKCFFIIFTLSLISCTFQEEDKQSKADNNNVLPVRADVTKPADFTKVKAWFKENVKENFLGAQTYVVLDNSGAKVFKSGRPLLKHIRN